MSSTTSLFPGSARDRNRPVRRILLACSIVFLGAVTLAGCGGESDTASPPPDYAKMLAGSPAPLAALHAQSDELLEGELDAFEARMKELRGFPAVVNLWASWCGPCRAELPHFQQVSAELGKKVAFLGVNSEDSEDMATKLMGDFPLPYPSFYDPQNQIYESMVSRRGLPATVFFDAEGNQTFTKQGPYPDQEALEADIQTFAIEGNKG